MAAAISPGEATRPAGASAASWSSASPIISTPSVRVGPGETALTRTALGPNSAAQALVSRFSAALLEPYRAMPALPNPPTMVGGFGNAGMALYGSSKAALNLLTKAWAAEFGPSAVRVNAVSPGPTRTEG